MKNLKGTFILLLAAFIWGTAFVTEQVLVILVERLHLMPVGILSGALFLFIVIAILDMRKYSDRYDNPSENNYNIYKKNYIIKKKII